MYQLPHPGAEEGSTGALILSQRFLSTASTVAASTSRERWPVLSGIIAVRRSSWCCEADLAQLVNVYNVYGTGLRVRTYFDYVPSKANVADLPSRMQFDIPKALGATPGRMVVPTLEQLDGPLRQWLDKAEQYVPRGSGWHVRRSTWPSASER